MKKISDFKTKKEIEMYVKSLLISVGNCNSIRTKSPEVYSFLMNDLFPRHSDYPNKISDVVDIGLRPNSINSKAVEVYLIKSDGSIDAISYINCITQKPKDELNGAFRTAITDQIYAFKAINSNTCNICNCNDTNIKYDVDHINYFDKLVYDFKKLYEKYPTTFDSDYDNRPAFKFEDSDFKDNWYIYHKKHASLQILCKPCNLKRKKWENPDKVKPVIIKEKKILDPVYLAVPYSEKDTAKALGARWNPTVKKWYAPHAEEELVKRWCGNS